MHVIRTLRLFPRVRLDIDSIITGYHPSVMSVCKFVCTVRQPWVVALANLTPRADRHLYYPNPRQSGDPSDVCTAGMERSDLCDQIQRRLMAKTVQQQDKVDNTSENIKQSPWQLRSKIGSWGRDSALVEVIFWRHEEEKLDVGA